MKERVLMLTTVASTQEQFCLPFVKLLQEMGYDTDIVCNFSEGNNISNEQIARFQQQLTDQEISYYNLPFSRNPLKRQNLQAYRELLKIIRERKYAFIHCHTPVAGAFGRLAAHKTQTKIIYMAHGFHFYKGAPLKNKLIYYPIEKICSYMTDIIITINEEDTVFAKRKLKAKKIYYLPGVGIDIHRFSKAELSNEERQRKRLEIDVPADVVMMLSVGELNQNKNHILVIKTMPGLPHNIHYVIAGIDKMSGAAAQLAQELGVADRIHFLGYRRDVGELCDISDVFVLPSVREGLSVSLMEAMAKGLPCAVSRIRGNVDLIDENGGSLFSAHDVQDCKRAIMQIMQADRQAMGMHNRQKIRAFSREEVLRKMRKIYEEIAL